MTNPTVHTLTDDCGREYEAFISEEIQVRHYSPQLIVHQKVVVVDCVKYRGHEVELSEYDKLKVLDDWDTQARIANINIEDYE